MNLQELRERIIEKVRTADEATLERLIQAIEGKLSSSHLSADDGGLSPEMAERVDRIFDKYDTVFQKLAQ